MRKMQKLEEVKTINISKIKKQHPSLKKSHKNKPNFMLNNLVFSFSDPGNHPCILLVTPWVGPNPQIRTH